MPPSAPGNGPTIVRHPADPLRPRNRNRRRTAADPRRLTPNKNPLGARPSAKPEPESRPAKLRWGQIPDPPELVGEASCWTLGPR